MVQEKKVVLYRGFSEFVCKRIRRRRLRDLVQWELSGFDEEWDHHPFEDERGVD